MAVVVGADIQLKPTGVAKGAEEAGRAIRTGLSGPLREVERVGGSAFSSIRSGIASTIGSVFSLKGALAGALAGFGADRAIREAAALEVRIGSLSRQFGTSRGSTDAYIASIERAAGGLLDFTDAASASGKAVVYGLPKSAVVELANYASRLAVATGEQGNFTQSFERLVEQIGQAKAGKLDDFGVFIDQKELQGLDVAAQRTVILNAALTQLRASSARLGVTGREAFFAYAGIFTNIKDIGTELSRAVVRSDTFKKVVAEVSALTGGIADKLRQGKLATVVGDLLADTLTLGKALALDLGEAIAVAIGQGIKTGLGLLGVELKDLLGKQQAEAVDAFLGKSLFTRTPDAAAKFGEKEKRQATEPVKPIADFGQRLNELTQENYDPKNPRAAKSRAFVQTQAERAQQRRDAQAALRDFNVVKRAQEIFDQTPGAAIDPSLTPAVQAQQRVRTDRKRMADAMSRAKLERDALLANTGALSPDTVKGINARIAEQNRRDRPVTEAPTLPNKPGEGQPSQRGPAGGIAAGLASSFATQFGDAIATSLTGEKIKGAASSLIAEATLKGLSEGWAQFKPTLDKAAAEWWSLTGEGLTALDEYWSGVGSKVLASIRDPKNDWIDIGNTIGKAILETIKSVLPESARNAIDAVRGAAERTGEVLGTGGRGVNLAPAIAPNGKPLPQPSTFGIEPSSGFTAFLDKLVPSLRRSIDAKGNPVGLLGDNAFGRGMSSIMDIPRRVGEFHGTGGRGVDLAPSIDTAALAREIGSAFATAMAAKTDTPAPARRSDRESSGMATSLPFTIEAWRKLIGANTAPSPMLQGPVMAPAGAAGGQGTAAPSVGPQISGMVDGAANDLREMLESLAALKQVTGQLANQIDGAVSQFA